MVKKSGFFFLLFMRISKYRRMANPNMNIYSVLTFIFILCLDKIRRNMKIGTTCVWMNDNFSTSSFLQIFPVSVKHVSCIKYIMWKSCPFQWNAAGKKFNIFFILLPREISILLDKVWVVKANWKLTRPIEILALCLITIEK